MDKEESILIEPYILDILQYCDGNNNITDISKLTSLSYKTTFFKIKRLEEEGFIKIDEKGISISTSEEQKVKTYLQGYIFNEKEVRKSLNNLQNLEITKILLNYMKKKRFSTIDEIHSLFPPQKTKIITHLALSGFLRMRYEITRKGLRLLQELKT